MKDFRDKVAAITGAASGIGRSLSLELARRGAHLALSDVDEAACRAYDVIHEKNLYGKKSMGIVRSTFLIDDDGKLVNEWRKVKVDGHADEVLAAVAAL